MALDEVTVAWESARAVWPELDIGADEFRAFVAARLSGDETVALLHATDLYLVCGCVRGKPAALTGFERVLDEVGALLRSLARGEDRLDEAKQIVRQCLVPHDDRPPAIVKYQGRGSLMGWLRVALGREVVRLRRSEARAPQHDSGQMARLVDDDDDPETAYLKAHYQREFKEAFASALDRLEKRERRILRYSVVERLSIDEIAKLQRTHRATAARQINRARERLIEETREILRERLAGSDDRLQSVFNLIESQVNVSIQRLLVS